MARKKNARLAYIKKLRAKHWGSSCSFCGKRWHKSKWNFYVEKSGACQGCMNYLAVTIKKGAAWILQRRETLHFWDSRLEQVVGGKKVKAA